MAALDQQQQIELEVQQQIDAFLALSEEDQLATLRSQYDRVATKLNWPHTFDGIMKQIAVVAQKMTEKEMLEEYNMTEGTVSIRDGCENMAVSIDREAKEDSCPRSTASSQQDDNSTVRCTPQGSNIMLQTDDPSDDSDEDEIVSDEDDDVFDKDGNVGDKVDNISHPDDRSSGKDDSDGDDVIQIHPRHLKSPLKDSEDGSSGDEDDAFDNFVAKVKKTPVKRNFVLISDDEDDGDTEEAGNDNAMEDFINDDGDSDLEQWLPYANERGGKENESPSPNRRGLVIPVYNNRKPVFKIPMTTPSSILRGKTPKSVLSSVCTPQSDANCNTPAYKRHFKSNRELAAVQLFRLFNKSVFESKLPDDFSITWNNRLRTTAGTCYTSRDAKTGNRLARIELSVKVCDCSERLRDTMIHEMCHAAAWMIDGKQDGHGQCWQRWAKAANSAHPDLKTITRCHKYDIAKKFTYRCLNPNCLQTYGRDSKSINLQQSTCGRCYSVLELLPQTNSDGTPKQARTPNRFALFVKENYGRVKTDGEGLPHKDIMRQLADRFAAMRTEPS